MAVENLNELLRAKAEELSRELEGFATNDLRLPAGKQLQVHLSIVNVSVDKVAGDGTKTRLSKGILLAEELTEQDWEIISSYEFDPKSKKVVDYYREHGNKPISFNQLVGLGVIDDPPYSQRFGKIQTVFNQNGGYYGLRREKSTSGYGGRKKDPYKIYKIAR